MSVLDSGEQITARLVIDLLKKRFADSREWVCVTEVAKGTGGNHRRLDMVAMNCFASNGYAIEGIEVKVSRADLRRELQDAAKHNVFFDSLDYYSLACPEDIADMSIIPPKWGVYVVKANGTLRAKRKPLALCDEGRTHMNKAFVASLVRNIAYEAKAPYETAIRAARVEGRAEGIEIGRKSVSTFENERIRDEHKAYKELFKELEFWSANDIERGIAGFKEYQALNKNALQMRLKNLNAAIAEVLAEWPDQKEEGQ